MASPTNLRSRRSAAQLHALAGVEREIRAQDSHNRRKYLREFNQAFRSYESLLDSQQIQSALHSADVVLIGDYHALPAAQRYAASLIEQRALAGDRPVVLGVETIFARDQHILDEWWRREIDETELRQRIRFDLDWGYDWTPFHELLVTARDHAEAVYGLDCMPREDLRKIGARDRHAAAKIAEIRERHPNAVIFVLFGESHLAPGHLPARCASRLPGAKVLTVLQNIDALYWRAAGERADKVEAVRVNDDVLCVFNATPLEKYESYRLFLDQWSRCDDGPDFRPHHLQPDRQPGPLPRNQSLLAAQRHAAEVSGRHAARSLRRPVRCDAAPPAVAQGHRRARNAKPCWPASKSAAAPTCRR